MVPAYHRGRRGCVLLAGVAVDCCWIAPPLSVGASRRRGGVLEPRRRVIRRQLGADDWRRETFGNRGTIVFGWVFASHQIGAAVAALDAGVIRDTFGTNTYAWWAGGALCAIAAALSIGVGVSRSAPTTIGATSARV